MTIKLVNQLLVGIHVVSTAEALAFAARKEMDLRALYEVIETAAGGSWCWNDREFFKVLADPGAPRMLNASSGSLAPHTNVLKDLEIIVKEAKALHVPVFFGATAQQVFTEARNAGYGGDDWGIVKLWQGLNVARP
jgi:putative dehydrogenase